MTQRPLPGPESQPEEAGSVRSAKAATAFRAHLTTYIVVGLFLLTLNAVTSFGDWWFQWPLFIWGWVVIFQAVATYGADTPRRLASAFRSVAPTQPSPAATAAPEASSLASIEVIEERIQRLWRTARKIPDPAVRDQAFRICAAADRVAEVMASDRIDARTVAWFNDSLLQPTESLLEGYVRLSSRGVSAADETLRRVEEQNLPQIASRFDALYDQLHRGAVVDLAVASEMLDLGPPEAPPARGDRVVIG